MTPLDRLKLLVNMRPLQAEEELRDGKPKSPDEIQRLVTLATGSELAGDTAWAKANLEIMRQQR